MPLRPTMRETRHARAAVEAPVPVAPVDSSRTVGQPLSQGQTNLASLRSSAPGVTLAAPRMSQNYKDTLNLPKTDFPMKASLTTREPEMLKRWEDAGLYREIQKAREGAELFVLHDGPPFANGDVHMGTALNKILKDLVVKSKT